jgi:hypothetical protein
VVKDLTQLSRSRSRSRLQASDWEMACRLGGVANPNSVPPWIVLFKELGVRYKSSGHNNGDLA